MKSENAIERRARVRSARLLERPMTLRNTVHILKYIGDVDQPEQEHGGFHEQTIQAARSALHHIERLRRRSNSEHEPRAVASRAPCSCSVWPCPTCGAVDWEDAGNKCRADWVCAADDQRQIDYEREQSTPNTKAEGLR